MNKLLLESMTRHNATDGQLAQLIRLENSVGMSIILMDIGATWLSCELMINDEPREVLLGIKTLEQFYQQSCYMGATIGRFANRIHKGEFELDGIRYKTTTNQAGNTLHGGETGFDLCRWHLKESSASHVIFDLVSEEGDQGFPGRLSVSVKYQLTEANQVIISYEAKTNKPTPVNLTNHAYFNLLGAESGNDCKGHLVQIDSDNFLPVDSVGIPLNKPCSVEGTGFDFRTTKRIEADFLRDQQQKPSKGYDHSYLLNPGVTNLQNIAAKVVSPDERLSLKLYTNKPALQLYTGNWLSGTPSRSGTCYDDYAGLALETQFLPDSPNHPEWRQPDCILRPGDTYKYTTVYEFDVHH
ncbi:galactose-1-epimerase [Vibrio ponticus]|uniref:Aldose 1-epimerase n=1 Tax=Vibrio ponticus TaxID=265668 RepID=A0A3N3DT89_9VIBR|nr:galactose-1-epimerase [Vibrio ponticus]ROV57675.1 galactose-1-epimerase [Vibrio ponticus]